MHDDGMCECMRASLGQQSGQGGSCHPSCKGTASRSPLLHPTAEASPAPGAVTNIKGVCVKSHHRVGTSQPLHLAGSPSPSVKVVTVPSVTQRETECPLPGDADRARARAGAVSGEDCLEKTIWRTTRGDSLGVLGALPSAPTQLGKRWGAGAAGKTAVLAAGPTAGSLPFRTSVSGAVHAARLPAVPPETSCSLCKTSVQGLKCI